MKIPARIQHPDLDTAIGASRAGQQREHIREHII